MTRILRPSISRRTVLGGLASFPALLPRALAEESATISSAFTKAASPITSADQAINVMDFEMLARNALPPAHFAYIATGVDDDRTVIRNHDAFSQYQVRARRFNDLRQLSAATSVFGVSWPSPIYLSAVSAMRAFHPDAEAGVARAARSRSTQLMLSTGASDSPEAVAAARGAPILAAALSDRRLGRHGEGRAARGECRMRRHRAHGGFAWLTQSRDSQARDACGQPRLLGLPFARVAPDVAAGADFFRPRRLARQGDRAAECHARVPRTTAPQRQGQVDHQGHRHA